MAEQQHRSTRKNNEDEVQTDVPEVDAERREKLDDDVDAILDEIDDVLEENAEEFVRSFVQKGGE
ncbi:ubiquitin-like protein Pup [Aeromicrobium massiliense]|uniref:ubiquitin-like protein Pup n=1 Tax=Aeromicrobium massiliense TaxID=1464554 RepID=UPI0002E289C7|nr:ubiquitin-like protein Pup [Aeromicrobium massiliense]